MALAISLVVHVKMDLCGASKIYLVNVELTIL